MKYLLLIFTVTFLSCSNRIYVVRHAEKEMGVDPNTMKTHTDPSLSFEGQERALQLKELLAGKDIKHIFSTNTTRTISTVKPLKEMDMNVMIQLYSSNPDSLDEFVQRIRNIKKGNVLIVGHSNTVDDIANKLAGKTVVPGDLKDNDYDNLYILKRQGDRFEFKAEKYGEVATKGK